MRQNGPSPEAERWRGLRRRLRRHGPHTFAGALTLTVLGALVTVFAEEAVDLDGRTASESSLHTPLRGGGPQGTPSARDSIVGIGGMCVDVAYARTADGTPVQLHYCTNNPAQRWTRPEDRTVRALGKCLTVSDSPAAGSGEVELRTCDSTDAQRWTYDAATRRLANTGAGKCLDTDNGAWGDGTPLRVRPCNGAESQKWTIN